MEMKSDEAGVGLIQTPVKVESPRCRRRQGIFKQIKSSRNEDVSKSSVKSSEGQECDAKHSSGQQNILVYIRRKHVKRQVHKKLVYSRRPLPLPLPLPLPDTSKEGSKGIVLKTTAKAVVAKPKHPRMRKRNDKKSNNKKFSGHEQVRYVEIVGKQSLPKVELDKRTVREWEISMVKLDSQGIVADEGEKELWETERENFHEQIKSFISRMQLIQGEMKFSQWKGSVLDSIVGAYLTQNVSDTLSSSAFISLAAKYPHRPSPAETVKLDLRSCRSKIKNDKILSTGSWNKTYSVKKKTNVISSKSVLKRNLVDTEDPCWKTETNYRRKRRRCEDDAIHWDALKKNYSKGDRGEKTYDTSDVLDWEAVRMAKVDDIANAIHKRGMSNNLATRIKNCLNILAKDLGSVDLEWIRDVPPHKAREYLLSIPGLGLKSVECIRLLTLKQKAFPIDTNAGRVAVRLGWVPIQPLPQGQEFHLLKEYPKADCVQKYLWPRLSKLDESTLYELHCQMITLGKVFCTKRNPNCNACPLRAECKHYTSYLASGCRARLALPGVPEKNDMHSSSSTALRESSMVGETAMIPIECVFPKCPQTVEVQGSDDLKPQQPIEWDIEDFGLNRIPQIREDEDIQKFINEKNIRLQEGEMSKTLMILNTESVSIPASKLKNAAYLRTEHQVYELPDSHSVLAELEKREPNDTCSYLLATWTKEHPDEDDCNSEGDTVYGTLLIPIRTAMRGKFPLNGTFFQANEVFADDESCEFPIKFSRASILNLPCATLYSGNNVSTICRGMKTHEVKKCFQEGSKRHLQNYNRDIYKKYLRLGVITKEPRKVSKITKRPLRIPLFPKV